MTPAQMRQAVYNAYDGKAWKAKVDKMSDIQVQAVYLSFSERGFFNRKKETKEPVKPKTEIPTFEPFIGTQISLF